MTQNDLQFEEDVRFARSANIYIDFDPDTRECWCGINEEPGSFPIAVFERRIFRFSIADYSTKRTIRKAFSKVKKDLESLADAWDEDETETMREIEQRIDHALFYFRA